jgi:predicted DNA-binding transcriptional regulator AlpA
MIAEQLLTEDVEFWPLSTVIQKVGLSRSEIYRRQSDGTFPSSRSYRNSSRRFWLSSDVRRWQAEELGAEPANDDDVGGLIG